MAVERPGSVRIGPHDYTILWSKKSWNKYLHPKQAEENVGKCQSMKNRIFINSWETSLSQQQDTLLHEILHAVYALNGWTDYDWGWPKTEDVSRSDLEEHSVRLITPHLLDILKHNPELTAWLTQ